MFDQTEAPAKRGPTNQNYQKQCNIFGLSLWRYLQKFSEAAPSPVTNQLRVHENGFLGPALALSRLGNPEQHTNSTDR